MIEFNPAGPTGPSRRDFTTLALGAGIAVPLTRPAQASEPAGLVNDVFGEALAELQSKWRELRAGENIFVGDLLATGGAGRLVLTIGRATSLRLGPESRLKIDRFLMEAGGTITLRSGPLVLNRPPDAPKQNLNIRGAFGMIAVRGTEIFAGPSRGKSGVLVLRGSVTVTSGGTTVRLDAGEGTDVAEIGARPSAPSLWTRARIDDALASVG